MSKMPVHRGSDLADKPVRWAWDSHAVSGGLTVIGGEPGIGKSLLGCDLAARWSAHLPMPDGSPNPLDGPATVMIMSADDDLHSTIAPRLRAHGAGEDRVLVCDNDRWPLELSGDGLRLLEDRLVATGSSVLILDPLVAYLPDSPAALPAVQQLAIRRDITVIGMACLAPGSQEELAWQVREMAGDLAFTLTREADGEDGNVPVLTAVKNKLGPALAPPLSFTIGTDPVHGVGQLSWEEPRTLVAG